MILARRGKQGPDPFLDRKVQIFLAGAALALVGIGLDSTGLVALAIVVLLLGMALRFFPRKGPRRDDEAPEGGENDVEEASEEP